MLSQASRYDAASAPDRPSSDRASIRLISLRGRRLITGAPLFFPRDCFARGRDYHAADAGALRRLGGGR